MIVTRQMSDLSTDFLRDVKFSNRTEELLSVFNDLAADEARDHLRDIDTELNRTITMARVQFYIHDDGQYSFNGMYSFGKEHTFEMKCKF